MRLRVPTLLIALLLLGTLPCAIVAEDLTADTDSGKKLLAEGDDLADHGKTTDAVIQYKRAFEQLLPGMRKLPFKHEVSRDVTPREELKAVLIKEIDEEMTEEAKCFLLPRTCGTGSIPCRRPDDPGSVGKELWFPFRTLNS